MISSIYKPFNDFSFNESTCYLTGQPASLEPVFPEWVLNDYGLGEKLFKYLDEHIVTYNDIQIPVSQSAETAFLEVDQKVEQAFNEGYEAVNKLDELILFQWISKMVYGTIHTEIRAGMKQQRASGEPFNFSQSLSTKFANMHLMLQSIISPVVFEGISPWSIKVFKLTESIEGLSYRDEINTMLFSLKARDFGIIACLQDNGESLNYHKSVLELVEGKVLHPIQFEELCARFFYSAYLFNRLPEYIILPTEEALFIESMPLRISSKPVYDVWQVKTYGQVLENFWKPWEILLFEIIKNPEKPLSFIVGEDGDFIQSEDIKLNS
jgi:hypothetical protein